MTMPPIFVMSEHQEDTASLKASLGAPGCAGLLVHVTAVDIVSGNLSTLAAMYALAAEFNKKVHLASSPLPMLAGQPSITLDGEARPLFWQPDCIQDDADVTNLLAAFVAKNNLMGLTHGLRCCFTTGGDGDAELGVHSAPASGSGNYWLDWADAGLTPVAYTAAMTAAAGARAKAFPGKYVSLSVLDPLDWRIGAGGAILARRDHGAMARALNQVCAAAVTSVSPFAAGNTNFRPTLPAADMIYTRAMGQLGSMFLQLDDSGSTAADWTALLNDAAAYAPAWIEAHQRQMTDEVWAGLL
jgi:hypothetical protein